MALRKMTVALALVAGLGVAATGAIAQTAVANAVKARHENFKAQGAAFKAINDELKKDSPSLAVITPNAVKLKASSTALPTWFPKGSGPESKLETDAKPEVWSDAAGFQAASTKFQGEALQARRGRHRWRPRRRQGRGPLDRRRLQELPRHVPRPQEGLIMAEDGKAPAGAPVRARLWDGPTRIVHWGIVILIAFSWWSAKIGKNMEWHRWSGYGVLGLILFRLMWGFVGSRTAQFSSFVRGPAATFAYLKTLPSRAHAETPGHNPVGALSVLAILAAVVTQVTTGLFSVDIDGIESGPLSDKVSFDTGRVFAKIHSWSFTAIELLVVLHIAAVAFYLTYKRSNLVAPMITGRRLFSTDPGLTFAPLWRAILVALIAGGLTWFIMKGLRL